MNINELVIKTDNELNAVEKEFLKNHQAIISAGVLIQNGFVELAKSLKNIRDNKLFLAIDCQSFEDYTEKVIGIKKTQAYKYIQVLENLGEEFSTRVEKVGITKLALISTLQEELKEKVIDKNDLEEISVSELKEQIRKLKDEKTKAQEETNKALEDKNAKQIIVDRLAQAQASPCAAKFNGVDDSKLLKLRRNQEVMRNKSKIIGLEKIAKMFTCLTDDEQAKIDEEERFMEEIRQPQPGVCY